MNIFIVVYILFGMGTILTLSGMVLFATGYPEISIRWICSVGGSGLVCLLLGVVLAWITAIGS